MEDFFFEPKWRISSLEKANKQKPVPLQQLQMDWGPVGRPGPSAEEPHGNKRASWKSHII
jgi:hypothetical protein